MQRIGTWRATTNLPILIAGALLVALVLTFVSVAPAHAVEIYDEGTYGSGYYSAADDAEPGGGDPNPGSEDPATIPGTPNTEAADEAGSVQLGPIALDRTSLWVGLTIIFGLTAILGAWTLRKQRR